MERRKLVSLCGTGGLAALAGCQAFGSTLRQEPPRFEDVELSGPNDATVGDSVSLSVSVTNAGGKQGDFADALTVEGTASSETPVRIEKVPPSESRTVEVGPYALGYAGDHRFALADGGASHVVSVSAPTLRAGEPFAVPDGPEVVVSDASTYASLFYDASTREDEPDGRDGPSAARGVLSPDEKSVLVVLRTSVANRGKQPVRVGPSSFDVADGEVVVSLGATDESLEAISGLDGEPFTEESIPPGESRSGWLLAEVSRASMASGLRVAWNRPRSESDGRNATTETESGETTESGSDATTRADSDETPEVRWTFDPVESPRFETADVTLLDAAELGSSVTATATVRNTGSVASTYRGVLERRYADESDWKRLETYERELSPGATATVGAEVRAAAVGRAEYRLRPGADAESGSGTASMTVRPAERALGEQFTTPEGAAIRVEVGTDAFDGLFSSYIYEDLQSQTVRAKSGHTFAFVNVTVENTASEPIPFPDRRAFSVVADGTAYSVFHSSSSEDVTFLSPVEGPWYATELAFEPGVTHSGWLVFQVPEETTVADLTVRWSPTDDVVAKWSE